MLGYTALGVLEIPPVPQILGKNPQTPLFVYKGDTPLTPGYQGAMPPWNPHLAGGFAPLHPPNGVCVNVFSPIDKQLVGKLKLIWILLIKVSVVC